MSERRFFDWKTTAFLIAELLIYALFLTFDLMGRSEYTILIKYGGILLCLLFTLSLAWQRGDRLIPIALALTAGADWFLLVRNNHLIWGVLLFLCVQTVYLIHLRRDGVGVYWWLRSGIALLLGVALYAMNMQSPLNLLAFLYFSQLLSNTILAWTRPRKLFAIGLTLFVGCDLCVGLFNSGLVSPAVYDLVSVGMWFFYLPSQVLISLSAKENFS